jgi:hypothetical protein
MLKNVLGIPNRAKRCEAGSDHGISKLTRITMPQVASLSLPTGILKLINSLLKSVITKAPGIPMRRMPQQKLSSAAVSILGQTAPNLLGARTKDLFEKEQNFLQHHLTPLNGTIL